MSETILEVWNRIDFLNIFVGLLLSAILTAIVRKFYAIWIASRNGFRYAWGEAAKAQLASDYSRLLGFRSDNNLLILWIGRRIASLVVMSGFLLVTIFILGLIVSASSENVFAKSPFEAPLYIHALFLAITSLLGIMLGMTSELKRIAEITRNSINSRSK